ncbi:hypothetical protein DERP_006904 [Dermatophagoides pteronyssinus]|uniref:Uncharacterized protein n=1 Tax=Dermatophagoides pteronyssinus TaxID=6956 RepID=A0ABQ8ISP4_DERPT|nr:hypothetical protein DERP_006904 [Dermatophagoides pteronyssinus]
MNRISICQIIHPDGNDDYLNLMIDVCCVSMMSQTRYLLIEYIRSSHLWICLQRSQIFQVSIVFDQNDCLSLLLTGV